MIANKNIISEFSRQLTNPENSDYSNLLSEGEKAALDQNINFQMYYLSSTQLALFIGIIR